ncbi:hypothetical protein GCM10027259_59120 [Micromonospora palomenae]
MRGVIYEAVDDVAHALAHGGAPAGPYNNTLWYHAYDWQRGTHGWINDHNLNTPGTAANPQPQTEKCWYTG